MSLNLWIIYPRQDKISFLDIGKAVYGVIEHIQAKDDYTLEDVIATDKIAREYVNSIFDIK